MSYEEALKMAPITVPAAVELSFASVGARWDEARLVLEALDVGSIAGRAAPERPGVVASEGERGRL